MGDGAEPRIPPDRAASSDRRRRRAPAGGSRRAEGGYAWTGGATPGDGGSRRDDGGAGDDPTVEERQQGGVTKPPGNPSAMTGRTMRKPLPLPRQHGEDCREAAAATTTVRDASSSTGSVVDGEVRSICYCLTQYNGGLDGFAAEEGTAPGGGHGRPPRGRARRPSRGRP
jgi:hypothetical protein